MTRAIAFSAAFLVLGACGTDDRANENTGDYATGELPTADTVQRESDVPESEAAESDMHVANKEKSTPEDERAN